MKRVTISLCVIALLHFSGVSGFGFFDSSKDHLRKSIFLALEANQLSSRLPEIRITEGKRTAEKQEQKVVSLMAESVKKSKKLKWDFVASIHKDLPRHYFGFLIEGQIDFMEALHNQDVEAQRKAIAHMMVWARFWEKNKKEIIPKI